MLTSLISRGSFVFIIRAAQALSKVTSRRKGRCAARRQHQNKTALVKPSNPYLRRQSSLSEKARLVNEYTLRQHAEWTKNSEMIEIYTHELAGESSEDLLLAYGIDVKKKNAATATTINDKGENKAAEASSSSSLYPRHARIAASQTSQPQNSASTVRWY
jgi:hypothetical protein